MKLIVLFFLFLVSGAQASAQIRFLEGSVNTKSSSFYDWFSWTPDPSYSSTPECSLDHLGQLKKTAANANEYAQKISLFWDHCSNSIKTSSHGLLYHIFKVLSMDDRFSYGPEFKPVDIQLDDHFHAHAVLSLQPVPEPRPLIVLRLGVLGEAYKYRVEKFLTQILYKELGYHVLVVSNSFSDDGLMSQPELVAGGFLEAYQNMRIGEILLSSPELKEKISELRLVGASLGGLGVLMAAGLEEKWRGRKDIYKNFVAFCPAVDLQKNLENLIQPGFFAKMIERRLQYRLKKALELHADVLDSVQWEPNQPLLGRLLQKGLKNHYLVTDRMKKYVDAQLINNDFVLDNRALPWLQHSRRPVFILSSTRDPLVPLEFNTQAVLSQYGSKSNIGIIVKDVSEHCTFSVEAAWPFLVALTSEIVSYSK